MDARTEGYSANQVRLRLADKHQTGYIKVDALTEASEAEIADLLGRSPAAKAKAVQAAAKEVSGLQSTF